MNAPDKKLAALTVGAIGVVFGDIGTSPLYALKESFNPDHGIPLNEGTVLGILSLMFWSLMTLVIVKYLVFMMRADNKGEGGILALTALAQRTFYSGSRGRWLVTVLGIFGAAMFYGDAVITPAMSVMSAVEGLSLVTPALEKFVLPIAVGILVGLFAIQKHGTGAIGRFFGPTMVLWFSVLAVLGIAQIVNNPGILRAIHPQYSFAFIFEHQFAAFVTLGAVVLCVTGGEALYADMGHFGKRPIRMGWFFLVWPALLLNYFGQGALMLAHPETVKNPFYLMAPQWALLPLIGLASAATVIASQAVISGAFSLTKQAIQLGYLPRFAISHTNDKAMGQIYVPFINWFMLVVIVSLVLGFRTSSNLAGAYGIAVTFTMLIDTLLLFVVMTRIWRWNLTFSLALTLIIISNDLMFLTACLLKFADGGWFPLVLGVVIFTLMSTWCRGREILRKRNVEGVLPLKLFIEGMAASPPARVEGTGVFMTTASDGVPNALLHNLKHNKVLHDRVVILSLKVEDIPYVPKEDYIWIEELGHGFWRITGHYGFKETPNVPTLLSDCRLQKISFDLMETSFFVNRETIISAPGEGMAVWREHIFIWMSHLAAKAADYFKIPSNRVVELGTQVEI
ncbi:MAG: potassium transporter Kup [Betaproteobacteria bacterium]|nr:potassium transporter Kup [Betaproteobacteria bacterium]